MTERKSETATTKTIIMAKGDDSSHAIPKKWFVRVIALSLLIGLAFWWHNIPENPVQKVATINETKLVCPGVWEQEAKHVNDHRWEDVEYFDVVLTTDDCFGADVWPPQKWRTWQKEFISKEPDAHVSFWFHGWEPLGPYFGNNSHWEFDSPPSYEARLKR